MSDNLYTKTKQKQCQLRKKQLSLISNNGGVRQSHLKESELPLKKIHL
jgi:hypothetical protein